MQIPEFWTRDSGKNWYRISGLIGTAEDLLRRRDVFLFGVYSKTLPYGTLSPCNPKKTAVPISEPFQGTWNTSVTGGYPYRSAFSA